MKQERTLYLHVGTHKTGTTSIQTFVTMNEPALAECGIFIPRAGRPARWQSINVGHHNLAWELLGAADFRGEDGTFAEAIDEIAITDAPATLLTAEDFFWLHYRPAALERIRNDLHSIGYSTRVIVYLRSQIEIINTLCAHNATAGGMLFDYNEIFKNILQHGAWPLETPGMAYDLEYSNPIDVFSGIFGADRVIVRPYRSAQPARELLYDFWDLIGGSNIPRRILLQPGPRNTSRTFFQVLQALHRAVKNRDPEAATPECIAEQCVSADDLVLLDQKFDVMTETERREVLHRFAADNRYLAERYGAGPPLLDEHDIPPRTPGELKAATMQRAVLEAAMRAWNVGSGTAS